MIDNYSLSSLLTLKTYNQKSSQNNFIQAQVDHSKEENKFHDIQNSLKRALITRSQQQQDFFSKPINSIFNQGDLYRHALSQQNNINQEQQLKLSLERQKKKLEYAEIKLNSTKYKLMDAERDLKLIEKHKQRWQAHRRKSYEIREEYRCDEQNNSNYVLKKHKI